MNLFLRTWAPEKLNSFVDSGWLEHLSSLLVSNSAVWSDSYWKEGETAEIFCRVSEQCGEETLSQLSAGKIMGSVFR
jgi:hypothetical protein